MSAQGDISAAITGHQNLSEEGWVRNSLREIIATERIRSGITSLAQGADQIFAKCLLDAGLPYQVVIPSAGYDQAFEDVEARREYSRLLVRATNVETLPFDEPSEAAFFAAGKHVVDAATFLIAVWNGEPAKGLGGTGDVVEYALTRGKKVVHVDCKRRTVAVL